MNLTKVLILIAALGLIIGIFTIVGKSKDSGIKSPSVQSGNISVPSPSPTPTPTPIIFNESSNLEEETKNLTPDVFSEDYKVLKEEAEKF